MAFEVRIRTIRRTSDSRIVRPWRTAQALLPSVILFVLVAGCGGDDVNRQNLSGTITYKGQPVPTGTIYFEPDGSKGNRGPQGFSSIIEGHYQTDKFGKGAVTGPIVVRIAGFPMQEDEGELVNEPLFPVYKTSADVSPETTTLDFEVPTNNSAAR